MYSVINGTWRFLLGKFERFVRRTWVLDQKCGALGKSAAVLGSLIRSAAHLVKVRRTWALSSIFFLRFVYDDMEEMISSQASYGGIYRLKFTWRPSWECMWMDYGPDS